MIKCPNCTGELKFKPEDKQIKCEYCGSLFKADELHEKIKYAEKKVIDVPSFEGKGYKCTQCGAELLTFDETAVTFCSYCGSQAIIEDKMIKTNNPDFIIPFSKSKEECIKAYKHKISQALFVPEYMKEDMVVDRFRGIYMPYCIYKVGYNGLSYNKGKKYAYRRGDYVYYDLFEIMAQVDALYDGISYDLISKYYDKFSYSIPYNHKEMKEFNPNYLLGYYADVSDVDSGVYEREAENIAIENSTKYLRKYLDYSLHGCSNPHVDLKVVDKKIGMFPVYFLAVRDKKGENVHYAVVNGQTGKVAVDLPVSFKKYIIGSLIMTPFIFLIINYLIVLTPKTVAVFSIIAGIFSLIILGYQTKAIKKRQTHMDDLGYVTKNGKDKIKSNFASIFSFYKSLIAILLPIIALLFNFVNDIYYYGAAIISLIFIILSFKDIISEHNLMVSNKLPQLEKRGGDERE